MRAARHDASPRPLPGSSPMRDDITLKLAALPDLPALEIAGDTVFDYPVKLDRAREFLTDPRHHLVLAYHDGIVVGMASGVDYVHPDKDPELFINEVGVAEAYQGQGIGRALVALLCDHGKTLGCRTAWMATAASNSAARKAYAAAGGAEDPEPVVVVTFA